MRFTLCALVLPISFLLACGGDAMTPPATPSADLPEAGMPATPSAPATPAAPTTPAAPDAGLPKK
jgi:hypothetical protein